MSADAHGEICEEPRVLRRARAEDVVRLAGIWHTGWADGHVGHVPAALVPYRTFDSFLSRIQPRIDSTWVAESAGEPVGFVVVKGDEIEQLYVDRPARGSGVAEALLRRGMAVIRDAGHRRAWLAVVEGNARARRFYERMGWRDAGPLSYMAETAAGPFAVPTRRYEVDLEGP